MSGEVIYGVVLGQRSGEHGHFLLVAPEVSPLEIREPKPFWVGVETAMLRRYPKGSRYPLGGARA